MLDIVSTPKPLKVLSLNMVLMSSSGVNNEKLKAVLSFSKFSSINAFDFYGILLLSCSHILQKCVLIESATPSREVIIASSSTIGIIEDMYIVCYWS